LAVFWWSDFDNLDASLFEARYDFVMFGDGFLNIDALFGVVGVYFIIVGKKICTRDEEFLVDHFVSFVSVGS
jgi:hypothetical protein